jgi:ethanolamine utilization protein EutN
MIVCNVIGNIVSTRKHENLKGCKFLMVKQWETGEIFVAADIIGAGAGEWVLVAKGSAARLALQDTAKPVDAAVVGIIDEESSRAWNFSS